MPTMPETLAREDVTKLTISDPPDRPAMSRYVSRDGRVAKLAKLPLPLACPVRP
jgi:hypothetical protein